MITGLDVALSQRGIFEATGKNDGIPAKRYMKGDMLAWCAGFCLFCNEVSDDVCVFDIDGDGLIEPADVRRWYEMRSVTAFMARAKEQGIWLPTLTIEDLDALMPNDFIFQGNTASDVGVVGSHMGILAEKHPDRFVVIEGNYANTVATVVHKRDPLVKKFVGAARPRQMAA